jgi:hypothetical protein
MAGACFLMTLPTGRCYGCVKTKALRPAPWSEVEDGYCHRCLDLLYTGFILRKLQLMGAVS